MIAPCEPFRGDTSEEALGVESLLSGLPAIDRFPTVDEVHAWTRGLAADNPGAVSLREVGRSRRGDPIELLTIAPTDPVGSALVVGQPHPNEPIGMATIMTMAQRLATDPDVVAALGVTWHFVPCADPDGTRLNEGWFAGPWTREHYARNFYRPGSELQVEWTFPFAGEGFSVDAPMPETEALMRAIDAARPDVLASLHNGELGGAYFYAGEGAPDCYLRLAELCRERGIPLHRGDPETPLSVELAPAVYTVPTAAKLVDFARSVGADPALLVSGASSLDYAQQSGPTFPIVVELPYWCDPRAADVDPDGTGRTRRAVALECLDMQEHDVAVLRRLLDAVEPLPESPFADAVRSFLAQDEGGWIDGEREQIKAAEDYDRPVSVAEAFAALDNVRMFRLRLGGMLLRAIPVDSPGHDAAERTFAGWAAEAAADNRAEPLPIVDLVAVQAGAILAAIEHALPSRA